MKLSPVREKPEAMRIRPMTWPVDGVDVELAAPGGRAKPLMALLPTMPP
jgi:hypothetical protein